MKLLTLIRSVVEKQYGQAALVMVLVVMTVMLVVISSVGLLTYNDIRTIGNIADSSQSYYTAEAGIEDIVYRISNAKPYNTAYSLSIGGGTTDILVTGPLTALVITSEGNVSNKIRKLEVGLGTSQSAANIAFNYGVQVGFGGMQLSNGAGVVGNVYSNGAIVGTGTTPGSGYVTGTAIAATGGNASANQVNDSPTSPSNSINFRNLAGSQDFAQSFQVSQTLPISKVQLYIKKSGNPTGGEVEIRTDSGGNPSGTVLASIGLNTGGITSSYGWLDASVSPSVQLNAGVTYWLVVNNSTQNSSNYFTIGANNNYSGGQAKVGQVGGVWNNTSPANLDGYFKIFLGGSVGLIQDLRIGTGGTGDGRANTINGSTMTGNKYCQVTDNSPACNTSQTDPSVIDFPVSDANLTQFKAEGSVGGVISGNYTPPGTASDLGPVEITGDLYIPGGHTLNVRGTIWVHGTITVDIGATIKLDPAYGSDGGTIISDGYILLENLIEFQGSGQAGSYVLLISTNDCNGITSPTGLPCTTGNSAIYVSNNAGTVILFTPKGQMYFKNNAGAKEATGYRLFLENNAIITYDSGLANSNFSSGPGAGYVINSWKEIE